MCKFLSLIATKSGKIYGDGVLDSHEEYIRANKDKDKELIDDKEPPNNTFARVEVIPKDGDIFNHKLSNWEVVVDERIKPKWWDATFEKKCLKKLKEVFKSQFIIGGKYKELNRDVRFLKNVKIKLLKSKVGEMWDSSQVGEMWDSSRVGKMWDSSRVGKMWGSSRVGEMWDSSQVGKMWDSSQVGEMWDSSQVGKMWGSSQVGKMLGSNTINIWSKNVVIKEQKNGRSVVIKRYLDKVKVVIK